VHLGGTFAEVAAAEADVNAGRMPDRPFVLVAQQSVADPSRAPAGKHTVWAYAHVPHGFTGDATTAIEAQIERFAPGFRDLVLARHLMPPALLQRYNPNSVGGDIAGGAHTGLQVVFRPTIGLHAYSTPNPDLFLCSASTPPGGGVHGMCGRNAAERVLATRLR
jgi:phytoene dehydrogenase-like protein